MVVTRLFHRLGGILDGCCGLACIFCLTFMVGLVGAQIVCRLFFTALSWSEELTRYLMIWATFLGAACVYRRMGHINVTIFQGLLSPAGRRGLTALCHLLCGAFFLVAVVYGLDYMQMQSRQLSPALRIPMSWIYLSIPVGFGTMAFHALDLFLLTLMPQKSVLEAAQ